MKKASDGGGRSCGRRHHGRRKLQTCPSVAEDAMVLFLDGGRSCTPKQRRSCASSAKLVAEEASTVEVATALGFKARGRARGRELGFATIVILCEAVLLMLSLHFRSQLRPGSGMCGCVA
ncbi:hypothetical protein B296_00031031 [Ensete ventricosum]|uniref:Uncharacterized protein n=1 Tax=Ensete ventricosum TaxID=4639 RepID=A0A426XMT8_ENSVE|nr:hypothetical protein B296_00031031 [Ensete ventricosum]